MPNYNFNAESTLPVAVVHLDQTIGSGEVQATATNISVTGSYEWPPDAPAEIPFSFQIQLTGESTCAVAVDWPELLPAEISAPDAVYLAILVLGRTGLLITTPKGDTVSFFYTGPMGKPGITTGFQVSVTEKDPAGSAVLTFRYR